jgi:hypothetical protein
MFTGLEKQNAVIFWTDSIVTEMQLENIDMEFSSVGTMVAVAEFSNVRKWLKGEKVIKSYEWVRYASRPCIRVIGGMGKILNKFIEEADPDDIMSYADLEWSDGDSYRKLGFEKESFRPEVEFRIDPLTWRRIPVDKCEDGQGVNYLYYKNFGSMKYRLTRTEY